jgi:hypothetical protein
MVLQLLPQLGSSNWKREESAMTVEELKVKVDGEMHTFTCIELLRYCDEMGEGTLALSQRFLDEPNLFKADVIQDWLAELTYMYNQILKEGL